MALTDLLVHVDTSEAGLKRLRLAARLASWHQARLVALHLREPTVSQQRRLRTTELGLVPAAEAEALNQEIAGELDEDERPLLSLIEELRRDDGLVVEYRCLGGHDAGLLSQQARTSDLTVIGHSPSRHDDRPDDYSFAESLLFTAGRPLLLVPPTVIDTAMLGRRIAVAWNGSRPAARALSDATGLIDKAEHVFVMTVQADHPGFQSKASNDAAVAHLRTHCNAVEGRMLAAPHHRDIARVLQAEALALGCDLLVAGAYGHARLWEKMLGGVTQDLLADLRLPALMSH